MRLVCFELLIVCLIPGLIAGARVNTYSNDGENVQRKQRILLPGGWSRIEDVEGNEDLQEVAEFVVSSVKNATYPYCFASSIPSNPKFKIARAFEQVVAGKNYRLKLVLLDTTGEVFIGGLTVQVYDRFGEMSVTKWLKEISCDQARDLLETENEVEKLQCPVGSYEPFIDVEDERLQEVAAFLLAELESATETYSFVSSLPSDPKIRVGHACTQVVAGMNYRLELALLDKTGVSFIGGFAAVAYDRFGELSVTGWGDEMFCDEAKALLKTENQFRCPGSVCSKEGQLCKKMSDCCNPDKKLICRKEKKGGSKICLKCQKEGKLCSTRKKPCCKKDIFICRKQDGKKRCTRR